MFRTYTQTKILWLAITLQALAISCQKTVVPDEYLKLTFPGLQSLGINDFGKLVLTWSPVPSDEVEGLSVTYHTYIKEVSQVGTTLSGEANTAETLQFDESSQPKSSGKLLKTTSASTLTIDPTDLVVGKMYAFQVIAKAGPKTGDNSAVIGLIYAGSQKSDVYELSAVSGNFQLSAPSSIFDKLTVQLDKNNSPVSGEIIDFSIYTGGGTLTVSRAVTDGDGRASTIYTAGTAATTAKVIASWNNGQKQATFSLIVSDPNASGSGGSTTPAIVLTAVSGNFQLGTISTTFTQPLKVKLANNGTAMSGKTISYTVSSGTGMTLSAASAVTDASGFAQITATPGAAPGAYVIHASYNSDEAYTDFQLIAQMDTKHLDIVSGNYQTGTVSTLFGTPLKVRLLASGGSSSPMAGETISFTITTGTATLSAASAVTDASGYAQVNFTAGVATGTYVVTAAWSGSPTPLSAVFYLIGNPVADNKILEVASGNFQVNNKNTTFAIPLQVRLRDGSTPLSGETISFAITAKPASVTGESLSAATATTTAGGLAQVNFTSGDKDGSYEITATWTDGTITKTITFAEVVQTNVAATSKIVKIVASGAGAQPEVTTAALDLIADQLTVKAALYDLTGTTYISDVSVAWALTGGGFNSADLQGTATGATSITFKPTRTGTTVLSATYMGTDTTVVGPTDSTGFLTVTTTLAPEVISIVAGDNQSAVVGSNLSTQLKVKVTNNSNVPVPGVGVNFTSQQGGGVVVTGQPVLTDADGFASATVQVGTTAMANIFRATVVSAPTLQANFQATANAGAATKLAFSTQPAQAFQNFKFLVQPIVVVQDTHGNLVTTANHTVTLAINTGSGALIGTLTATAVNGIASFVDVGSDTVGTGLSLTASSSPVLTTATSNSFDVGAALASACTTEDSFWKTAEGGCKDLNSNLIWSGVYGGLSFYSCAWDSYAAGSSAADASDNGWTNDYDPNSPSSIGYDTGSTSQCHDLTLGGYTDWRIPTLSEMQQARANGIASHKSTYNTGTGFSTSTRRASTYNFHIENFIFTTGATAVTPMSNAQNCACVRSSTGRPVPTQLVITASPSGTQLTAPSTFSVTISTRSAGNQVVNREGLSITASIVSGAGNIAGTLTRTTDRHGSVTFSDLTYSSNDTPTIRFTASTISASVDLSTVTFTYSPGGCTTDANFDDTEGGCKDLNTGLVWSAVVASGTLTWHQAIWDASVAGSSLADANDNGWTNEYRTTVPGAQCDADTCDSDSSSYCHDLNQGGYTDWRVPSLSEMSTARVNGLHTKKTLSNTSGYWIRENTRAFKFTDGTTATTGTANPGLMCVRGGTPYPTPYRLKFRTQSVGGSTSSNLSTFYVQIVDSSNNQVNQAGTTITVSKVTGTGTMGGTMTATTNRVGIATFSAVTYDTAESFTITASASGLLGPAANMPGNVGTFPGSCGVNGGSFTTANGGCQDTISNKVWSRLSTDTYDWYELVWDASAPSGNSAQDADDSGRTTDRSGTAISDASLVNYCHDLIEGGKTDWRAPTASELQAMISHGGYSNVGGGSMHTLVWSATNRGGTPSASSTVELSTGTARESNYGSYLGNTLWLPNKYPAYCIRP